ncbi:MAG: hypothetical protein M3R04_06435 [bacterium]|nr:hypothetical protein [bacterium]
MKNNRHRRTDRQWLRLFELHRQSGLSAAAFCGEHGLAVSTFFARRASLLRRQVVREGESAATLCGAKAPPRFVEVKVDDGAAADFSVQADGGDGDGSASPSPSPSPSPSTSPPPSSSSSSSTSITAAPVSATAPADADVDAIELLLGGDVVVQVRVGFNASLLRQVVASLRELR